MSEFQEIKHLYSYGIQTCLTGMHFHQDLCVFVDSGFKTFRAFYGDSQWGIHGTYIFARTEIARVICFRDHFAGSVQGLPNLEGASRVVVPSLNNAEIRAWRSRPAHMLTVSFPALQMCFLSGCAPKVSLAHGASLHTKPSGTTFALKSKPCPASADGLVQ